MRTFDPAAARALVNGRWLNFTGYPGLKLFSYGAHRTWVYRFGSPIDGRMRQVRLGHWPAVSWEKAVARWEELRKLRDDGIDPAAERKRRRKEARDEADAERAERRRAEVTVARVIQTFLDEHIAKECKTEKARYDAKWLFRRAVVTLGARPAHKIDRGDASDFLAQVKLEAPSTARLLRARLGGAWEHAMARRLLPANHANPWRDALRGKLSAKSRMRFLDDREIAAFLKQLPTLPDTEARDALHLALLTGARTGEIVAMEWPAIDLERSTWTIGWTKTGISRTVRLPRQAVAILKSRGHGFEIPQPALSAALRDAKHLGLKHFTPHDLRRSVRTGLSRIGVRDEVAEAALGHVEGGIRGVYNLHSYEREVGEALQAWCDHLDALVSPNVTPLRRREAS